MKLLVVHINKSWNKKKGHSNNSKVISFIKIILTKTNLLWYRIDINIIICLFYESKTLNALVNQKCYSLL